MDQLVGLVYVDVGDFSCASFNLPQQPPARKLSKSESQQRTTCSSSRRTAWKLSEVRGDHFGWKTLTTDTSWTHGKATPIKVLCEHAATVKVSFDQCRFGAKTAKPTILAAFKMDFADMAGMRCNHQPKDMAEAGRDYVQRTARVPRPELHFSLLHMKIAAVMGRVDTYRVRGLRQLKRVDETQQGLR